MKLKQTKILIGKSWEIYLVKHDFEKNILKYNINIK